MKREHKQISWNIPLIYFMITCFITIIFIFSPLIIRIPFIYDLISWFLEIFKDTEYKSIYIGTVGTILGTFLAITGTLLTQNLIDKHNKNIADEKNALIVYYDLKPALYEINDIMNSFHDFPSIYTDSLDDISMGIFKGILHNRYIYVNSDWRGLIASLERRLTGDTIQNAHVLYKKLSIISTTSNERNIYDLMSSLMSDKSLKKEYTSILSELAAIANIEYTENGETE